jgi:hypothetical protein
MDFDRIERLGRIALVALDHWWPLALGGAILLVAMVDVAALSLASRRRRRRPGTRPPPVATPRRPFYAVAVVLCLVAPFVLAADDLQMRYEAVLAELRTARAELSSSAEKVAQFDAMRFRAEQLDAAHWDPLTSEEARGLRDRLAAMERAAIAVYCNDSDCRELADTLVAAFRGAGWTVESARSVIDPGEGISMMPDGPVTRLIATAIEQSTAGRLKVALVASAVPGRMYLDIGNKPR